MNDQPQNNATPTPTPGYETLLLPPKRPKSLVHELLLTVSIVLLAILVALFVKAYVVQPYVVDGQSMETTLQNGDRLLVDKLPVSIGKLSHHPFMPKRGDIIIFNQSNLPGFDGNKQLIKRVIGLPGERVVVSQGFIKIYNPEHPKGFNPDTSGSWRLNVPTPNNVDLTIGHNQLFVCGDNRPYSEDSRAFGPINDTQIVGRLSLRIFPLGKVRHY